MTVINPNYLGSRGFGNIGLDFRNVLFLIESLFVIRCCKYIFEIVQSYI